MHHDAPKTDYAAHEGIYKQKQARGQAGWDPAEISAAVWQEFAQQLQHDAVPEAGRLLELGCGAGNLSVGFAGLGYQVTGVDISPTAVEWARQRAAEKGLAIDFLVGDVLSSDLLKDTRFSVVVDSHCFHCIIGPDRAAFLANARRWLAPDGALILNCMIQNDQTKELEGFAPDTGILWKGDVATRTISTRQAIEEELTLAGYACLESKVQRDGEPADTLLLTAKVADTAGITQISQT